jgi:hypothetical protein
MIDGTAREDFLARDVTQYGDVEAMKVGSCLDPVRGALRHSRLSARILQTPDRSFKERNACPDSRIWNDSPSQG